MKSNGPEHPILGQALSSRKCLRQGDLARPCQAQVGWLKLDKCVKRQMLQTKLT